ncbi:PQQ-binding-like beta-propeller repeat protein [Streptomyces sp. CA-210063]|uniref:beta-alanine-activating enzyme beta-propeller domain-containing protein n=1 Tax=Streptomyces sp. CA-210063 TaxID=2801029 RepID=UPI00214ADF57|nr:PQQ-binding-like beta-propeller repeat protein [Streptomyces sp. CA-210063]UUU32830.1 PQQ-binding-like beta-propeller repeat protein [Streptomyces sp. CA-210063]
MAQALENSDPRQVGPYRIVGRLGAGGMGRVYLGLSPGGRAVAVKTIRPELTYDPEFRQRFAREAAAARAVSGAFTAAVVDADPYGDPPWLATVHVAGISLDDTIARHGPLPESSVLALGAGLSEALQAIHTAGLVHRDLKPSNVLLAPDGPKVIDFGIAISAGSSSLTRSGVVVGTPAYMSPEQLTGGRAGTAADVFALGGVLVFAATGEGAFGSGPSLGVGFRVVHDEPNLSGVPAGLRPLLGRCLDKVPARRPTVAELLAEFARRILPAPEAEYSTDTVTLALHGGAWLPESVASSVRRAGETAGPGGAGEAGGIGGTLVPEPVTRTAPTGGRVDPRVPADPRHSDADAGVGVGVGAGVDAPVPGPASGPVSPAGPPTWIDGRSQPRPERIEGTNGPEQPQPASDPLSPARAGDRAAPAPTRRRVLAVLAGAGGVAAVGVGTYLLGRGENDPDKGSDNGTLKDPGGVPSPGDLRWRRGTGGPVAPALLAVGGLVYAGSKDGSMYALDAETGKPRWQFGTGNGVYTCPAVAGGLAYFGSADYHLYAVEVKTGEQRWQFSAGGEVNSSPVVAGGVVYAGSDDARLYAVDARSGDRKWTFAAEGRIRSSPVVAWNKVYVGSEDSRLYAVDAATGERRWAFKTDGDVKSSPAVADRVVYVGSYDGNLYAVNCDTGELLWSFATRGGVGSSPAVSGGVVYVGSDDGNLYAVDALTGKQKWKFTVGAIVYSSPAVLGDAVYVGSKNGNLYAVRTDTGKRLWTYRTGADIRSSPTATDATVYVGNDSGTVFAVNR